MSVLARREAGWGDRFLLARAEWRGRWRSHLVIVGFVAVTVAVTVATLSGAIRSGEAFDRLRAATRAADVVILHPDTQIDPVGAVAAVKRVDGVSAAAAAAVVFVRPVGTEFYPDFDLYPIAPLRPRGGDLVNTPVVTDGRPVDPERVAEVALGEDLAAELGLRVGDMVTLESMTTEWVETGLNGGDPGPPDGPRVEVEVVGLTRTPGDFGRSEGVLWLSPAFVERFGGQMRMDAGVHARFSPEALGEARAGGLVGFDDVELGLSPFADIPGVDDGLGTIAAALRLVVAAAALAGVVVTALALARLARLMFGEGATLRALGWRTRDMVEAAVLTLAPWLLVGVGVGVIVGVFVSPAALVGLARSVDPDPRSVVVDGGVILAVTVIAVAVGLFTAAWPLGEPQPPSGARLVHVPEAFRCAGPCP